ncbi:hypothetical protein AURDEDRAFT_117245 [Auricularia subglabra TFB-10046 SS5]|uniref:Uncharacterized protein n=1 Tax=Auricularia subglabra (strain TFB-10046 / SS5) TaxID=717982 RepID=J0WTP1_AURST|nr:hypothetical protein AURDEDRAFT_117245 [Auricularia subglabra TFB-10046 SS5]
MSESSLPKPGTPGPAVDAAADSTQAIGATGGYRARDVSVTSEADEKAELEAQLRVQSIVDLLEKIPKKFLWELLVGLGVRVPPPNAATGMSKFALVCEANQHLHEELHGDGDIIAYEVTVCSYIEDLVDNGLMTNPWAFSHDGEQPGALDVYHELARYVQDFRKQDLRLVALKICCICLLDAKTQPMEESKLREELMQHLQHRVNEEQDLLIEADVLRRLYREREEQSEEESDTESDTWLAGLPNVTQGLGLPPTAPPGLPQILSESESLARIDELQAKLRDLPGRIVIDVLADNDLQLIQFLGDKAFPLTKDHVISEVVELLRSNANSGTAISCALRRCDTAMDRHVEKWLSHTLQKTVISRGRPWRTSKKFEAIRSARALRDPTGVRRADEDSE